jgi:dephospho-CoA kinase
MSTNILLICGFDRSGKTTASKIIEKSGFHVFECGAVVKELTTCLGKIEISRFYEDNMRDHNSLIIEKILAISSVTEKLAIIGVRSIELYAILKEIFPELRVLFIDSESQIRYERYSRTNDPNTLEFKIFLTNDSMQIKWGLEKIKFLSDFVIFNNGDYLGFVKQVYQLSKEL